AQAIGWPGSYTVMASLVIVGLITTLLVREPHPSAARSALLAEARTVDFLERQGAVSTVLLLLLIGSCRLTTYAMGSMVNPFYIDHHYTLDQIATIVKGFGLPVSLVGVVIAGSLVVRMGVRRVLILGCVVMLMSNLSYALLATTHGPTLIGLIGANSIDNLGQALQSTAFIAFLSALTSPRYTATQYALFSSLFLLTGKLLEGTSGFVVDAIGYPTFFVYTA